MFVQFLVSLMHLFICIFATGENATNKFDGDHKKSWNYIMAMHAGYMGMGAFGNMIDRD